MLSTAIFSSIVAISGLLGASAAPLVAEKRNGNYTNGQSGLVPFNSTVAPVFQIHPVNRTDLVSAFPYTAVRIVDADLSSSASA